MATRIFSNSGKKIATQRKSKGYTLEKFSRLLKIPLSTLSGYERGISPIPQELRGIIKEKLDLEDSDFAPDPPKYPEPNAQLVSIKDEPIKRRVPVVSWALAGAMEGRGAFEDLANQIDETVETTSRDPNAFAIEISDTAGFVCALSRAGDKKRCRRVLEANPESHS
jgi:transcriptional regulator with XRE-family HTH domain